MIISEKAIIVNDKDNKENFRTTGQIIESLKLNFFDECLTADIVIYNGMIVKNHFGEKTNKHPNSI